MNLLQQRLNTNTFVAHDVVQLHQLQTTKFNGKLGTIIEYISSKNRYAVKIANGYDKMLFLFEIKGADLKSHFATKNLLIKPENLKLVYPYVPFEAACRNQTCKKRIKSLDTSVICEHCNVVLYCSNECRSVWCSDHHAQGCIWRYKEALLQISKDLHIHSFFDFNVFDNSLRQQKRDTAFGNNHIQLLTQKILQKQTIPIIKNWKEYYNTFNISSTNTFAVESSHILTIYHILVSYLKLKPKSEIGENSPIIKIHLIGCHASEYQMDVYELLGLLTGYNFVICAFGDELKVSQNADYMKMRTKLMNTSAFEKFTKNDYSAYEAIENPITKNWALVEFYESLYSENSIKSLLNVHYQIPDIIIGLNIGFTATPNTLRPVLKYISSNKIPAVFSEWTLSDMYMYPYVVSMDFDFDFNYVPNPFRCPLVITKAVQTRIPFISNGYLCGINTKIV